MLIKRIFEFCNAVRDARSTGIVGLIHRAVFEYEASNGYRRYGLLHDDLAPTYDPLIKEAISRLHPLEQQERVYRCRRAAYLDINKEYLPINEQTKPCQDVSYLAPHIERIEAETYTKKIFNNLQTVPEELMKRNRLSSRNVSN